MKSNPLTNGGRRETAMLSRPRAASQTRLAAQRFHHAFAHVCAILRHNPPTKISHTPYADSCCPVDGDATVRLSGNDPVHAARGRIFGRRIVRSVAVSSRSGSHEEGELREVK